MRKDQKEFVTLRNDLVHNFILQHNLWSMEGCCSAQEALVAADRRIGEQVAQLREWVKGMADAEHLMAEVIQSDQFQALIIGKDREEGAGIDAVRTASAEVILRTPNGSPA